MEITVSVAVEVVIVSYNSGGFLQACIDALALQTFTIFKVLIVDNASTDDAVTRLVLPDSRFRIWSMGCNVGFAAANNWAVRQSSSEFVVLLNPDTQVHPGWLAALLEASNSYPHAASIGSVQIRLDDPSRLDGLGDVWHLAGLAWRSQEGKFLPNPISDGEIFGPCAAAALYRRTAFIEVGGFDERYFCYMEDVDLAFRLRLAGYTSVRSGSAIVSHAGSGTTGRYSEFSLYYGHRNRIWTFLKNTPKSVYFIALPYHILFNLLYGVIAVFRWRWRPIFRAYWDAWRGCRPFLEERHNQARQMGWAEFMRLTAWTPWSPWGRSVRPK